jgi:hypothetical protein
MRKTTRNKTSYGGNEMATTSGSTTTKPTPTGVAMGVVSEAILPGGSHLIKGDLKETGINLALALVAGALLGPLGVLAVKANSLAKAVTGRGMLDQINTD